MLFQLQLKHSSYAVIPQQQYFMYDSYMYLKMIGKKTKAVQQLVQIRFLLVPVQTSSADWDCEQNTVCKKLPIMLQQ